MVVKIVPNDKGNPPGKLADAELHFTEGVLEGLKLVGFAVWERRSGSGRNVTFPSRQYTVSGDRRSFALLRPVADAAVAGTRARPRPAGVRRVRGFGNTRPLRRLSRPDAAIVAASGIASERLNRTDSEAIMATMQSSGAVKSDRLVRESVRQGHVDGYRGRESPGRLTVHRALLATEGCWPAIPQDGTRGAIPASRRGRLRTAGSRRDAGRIRSRPNVIALAPRPHWHAGLNSI